MAAVTRRQYKGAAASTTTTNSLTSIDTSVTLAATTGWPSTASVPFYVVIDPGNSSEEKCSVTISGSTLTLTRGADDTTAVSHSSGATIYPVFSAVDADEANELASKLTTKGDLLATDGSALNRLAVGDDGAVLMADSAQTNGVAWSTAQTSNRNKFINGAFYINQRGFTSQTTDGAYGFDRWRMYASSGGTYSTEAFTAGTAPVAGYEGINFARIVTTGQTGAAVYTSFDQPVEDVRTFAGQTVTISFWAKAASGTPKVSFEIVHNYGSGGSGAVFANGGTATISTSWARYSLTVSVPSVSGKTIGAGSYLDPTLWVSAGTNFAARANSIGIQSNTFDFWGIQLEAGSVATPFEFEDYGTTLAKCFRYFQRIINGADETNEVVANIQGLGATAAYGFKGLLATMRGAPTVSSTAANTYLAKDTVGNNVTPTSISFTVPSPRGFLLNIGAASGLTAGASVTILANSATATLDASAEL
jgi:hypothetical protein